MSDEPSKVDQDGGAVICVRGLLFYGMEDGPRASECDLDVCATPIAAGSTNTVSARLAAQLTSVGLDRLLAWATSGDYFCELDWTFPKSTNPRFSTRHILTAEETTNVSFSGGLTWAIEILSLIQTSQGSSPPSRRQIHKPRSHQKHSDRQYDRGIESTQKETWSEQNFHTSRHSSLDEAEATLLPVHPQSPPSPPDASSFITTSSPIPPTIEAHLPHHEALGDASFVPQLPTWDHSGEYTLDPPGSPGSLTTGTTRASTPCWEHAPRIHDSWIEEDQLQDQVQNQIQIDIFRQRQQEAEALLAQTGDWSGYHELLRAASTRSGLWQPNGRAYF